MRVLDEGLIPKSDRCVESTLEHLTVNLVWYFLT